MSEREKDESTNHTPGPNKPGGEPLQLQRITAPCVIVEARPGELFAALLGDGAGYCMDPDTGLLRVWDRESTYQVNPSRLVLLRVGNVVKRGTKTGAGG